MRKTSLVDSVIVFTCIIHGIFYNGGAKPRKLGYQLCKMWELSSLQSKVWDIAFANVYMYLYLAFNHVS